MRSSAKPMQAMTCLRTGARDRFGWTDEELAVVCASHSAEAVHRSAVRRVLGKAGLDASALQCGPHPPIESGVHFELVRGRRPPTRIYSNCSGKHAGMLATCRANGWPIESYRAGEHPLQVENGATMAAMTDLAAGAIATGLDGCGVPTFFLSLRRMATAFARLAQPRQLAMELADAARSVTRAMTAFPRLVAGAGRWDTDLIGFAGGRLVSKGGAEGVICVGLRDHGLGIALKTSDGSARCHPAVLCRLLRELAPELDWETFEARTNRPLANTRGDVVGSIEATL
jgi:L-asparaginase II